MTAKIRLENGVVVGTSGGKYELKNPLARWMLAAFDRAVSDLARRAAPATILEVGCGEGHVLKLLVEATQASIHATDISPACIAAARAAVSSSERVSFGLENLMTMAPTAEPPDLVVCCEVLEHLDDPRRGLEALVTLRAKTYLISVPREPLWRILNFSRGAYVRQWGNSPGHVQHWSRSGFLKLVRQYLNPIAIRSPVPWTVLLCEPKGTAVA